MGCNIFHSKDTKLCVDHLMEKDGAEQARRKTAGLVFVQKEIPTAENAVKAV